MAPTQFIALLATVVLLSTGIGFAIGQASDDDAIAAPGGSSAVVSQLKKLNRATTAQLGQLNTQLQQLYENVGTSGYDIGSIHYTLFETCQALKGTTTAC